MFYSVVPNLVFVTSIQNTIPCSHQTAGTWVSRWWPPQKSSALASLRPLKCLFVCTGSLCPVDDPLCFWWKPFSSIRPGGPLTKKKVYFSVLRRPREGKGSEDLATWLNCSAFFWSSMSCLLTLCIKLQCSLSLFFPMECIFRCKLLTLSLFPPSFFPLLESKHLPLSRMNLAALTCWRWRTILLDFMF